MSLAHPPRLVAENLWKIYQPPTGVLALQAVGFELLPGEVLGLLGPNGAGKTTLMSLLCGLLKPTRGEVFLLGQALSAGAGRLQSRIGFVPQEIALFPTLSVAKNLRFWGRLHGLSAVEIASRSERLLARVGLAERASTVVKELSGGMKRRLNLAVALLHEPAALLLDEPTVGVDPQSRHSLLDLVRELADQGLSILYSTHYMEEAEAVADRVLVLDRGRPLALGTAAELRRGRGLPRRGRLELVSEQVDQATRALAALGVTVLDFRAGTLPFLVPREGADAAQMLSALESAEVQVLGFELREVNLEELFLHLTGTSLRDEG